MPLGGGWWGNSRILGTIFPYFGKNFPYFGNFYTVNHLYINKIRCFSYLYLLLLMVNKVTLFSTEYNSVSL